MKQIIIPMILGLLLGPMDSHAASATTKKTPTYKKPTVNKVYRKKPVPTVKRITSPYKVRKVVPIYNPKPPKPVYVDQYGDPIYKTKKKSHGGSDFIEDLVDVLEPDSICDEFEEFMNDDDFHLMSEHHVDIISEIYGKECD